jgi:hypothetical protein
MAIYRLHRKEWERGNKAHFWTKDGETTSKKRKGRNSSGGEDERKFDSGDQQRGGRRGVSSGRPSGETTKKKWWKEVGGFESKGSFSMSPAGLDWGGGVESKAILSPAGLEWAGVESKESLGLTSLTPADWGD